MPGARQRRAYDGKSDCRKGRRVSVIYAEYHFPSDVLGRSMRVHVLLPRQRNLFCPAPNTVPAGGYRCLWFLHGLGDDGAAVLHNADVAALCDAYETAVILPDVENSFCLDAEPNARFRAYLLEELIPFTLEGLPVSGRREDRFLGGISMGGYGALSLGLERPELWSRVIALSPALNLTAAVRYARLCRIPLPAALTASSSCAALPGGDPEKWLRRGDPSGSPRLFLTCGTRDMFRKSNAAFAALAAELGYDITESYPPGAHDWNFWRDALNRALRWALS